MSHRHPNDTKFVSVKAHSRANKPDTYAHLSNSQLKFV